jgi:hypothetical protein
MRTGLMASVLLLTLGCGQAELTIRLETDPAVSERVVWLRAQVQQYRIDRPTIYPAIRVSDGRFRLPIPKDGHPFYVRIDACGAGDGCEARQRIAAGCSQVMSIAEGERLAPIFISLLPVTAGEAGCP